ncbi:MAG: SOS response-associated peptidase [Massilia sp.]
MCANYTPSKREAFSHHYGLERAIFDMPAETFPGYIAPMLRESHETAGQIECVPAVFGLVPSWADMKLSRQTYNARTETVATKPSFRNAWKRNQFCIVPAENFFEPNYESGKPERWRIAHTDARPLSIAGIWEWKANGPNDLPVLSFSMLTINADGHGVMGRFHKPDEEKRMLVLLEPEQYQGWLEGALVNDPAVYQPYPAEKLVAMADPLPPRTRAKPVQASFDLA